MNYIQQLQLDNKALRAEVVSLYAGLNDILAYVGSDKFRYPYDSMNPKDIILRCYEAISAGDSAANQVYADDRSDREAKIASAVYAQQYEVQAGYISAT